MPDKFDDIMPMLKKVCDQRTQAVTLLLRLSDMFPDKQTLLDIHADDMNHARKYSVTLTDNFMLEIHDFLEKL